MGMFQSSSQLLLAPLSSHPNEFSLFKPCLWHQPDSDLPQVQQLIKCSLILSSLPTPGRNFTRFHHSISIFHILPTLILVVFNHVKKTHIVLIRLHNQLELNTIFKLILQLFYVIVITVWRENQSTKKPSVHLCVFIVAWTLWVVIERRQKLRSSATQDDLGAEPLLLQAARCKLRWHSWGRCPL